MPSSRSEVIKTWEPRRDLFQHDLTSQDLLNFCFLVAYSLPVCSQSNPWGHEGEQAIIDGTNTHMPLQVKTQIDQRLQKWHHCTNTNEYSIEECIPIGAGSWRAYINLRYYLKHHQPFGFFLTYISDNKCHMTAKGLRLSEGVFTTTGNGRRGVFWF